MKAILKNLTLTCILSFYLTGSSAQLEKIIIENYYVSDSLDAVDTSFGKLTQGSTTYRIFVDLKPGSVLRKIYGNANHPIKILSTETFFNHVEGQTFANEFSSSKIKKNITALDTWLALGETTRPNAITYFGILKSQDRNGSFIGGINNSDGLLNNADVSVGIPLAIADGMDTMSVVPTTWSDFGFRNSGKDSSIFGSIIPAKEFISYNAALQNSGVTGVIPDSNQILIAQLTTKGDISFEINLEVEEPLDSGSLNKKTVKYVARDTLLQQDEIYSPYLKYPYICGCQDPDYLEAQTKYVCEDKSACKTKIVFGCMDSMACNYNEFANFDIHSLCCYIGYCNDLDISIVCPNLKIRDREEWSDINIHPNPAMDHITIKVNIPLILHVNYMIYDSFGRLINTNKVTEMKQFVDVSSLKSGLYFLRISTDDFSSMKSFIKI